MIKEKRNLDFYVISDFGNWLKYFKQHLGQTTRLWPPGCPVFAFICVFLPSSSVRGQDLKALHQFCALARLNHSIFHRCPACHTSASSLTLCLCPRRSSFFPHVQTSFNFQGQPECLSPTKPFSDRYNISVLGNFHVCIYICNTA